MNDALPYLPATELLAHYRGGDLSPVEVATETLRRIERLEPELHAFARIDAERFMEEARDAEAVWNSGHARELEGIPVVVKDVYASGHTAAGSRVRASTVETEEATAVRRLRAAGALVVGKTTTYEFAFGRPSRESWAPPARNPWQVDLEPGGSSSGSAVAVAAGIAQGGLGTDTAGSVRWPAAQCGITGLKPTYGRIPRSGIVPLAWSLDHAGVMARTVEDAALLLHVVAGPDERDPTSAVEPVPDYQASLRMSHEPARLGVPWELFESSCAPEILACFEAALHDLERIGVRTLSVPSISMTEALAITYPLLLAEAASYHLPDLRARNRDYGRDLRVFFAAGLLVDAEAYLRCQRARERLRREQLSQLGSMDGFVLPTVGFLAERIPDRSEGLSFLSGEVFALYTMAYNLTGLPAISVPSGVTTTGLPVGLQIVGRPFDEARVLAFADDYQRATPWAGLRPPVGREPS